MPPCSHREDPIAYRRLRQDVLGPHAEKLPWGGSQQSQESGVGSTNTVEI